MLEKIYFDPGQGNNQLDEITYRTIGCAIEVHRQLGAGLSDAVYEACFTKELVVQNIRFQKLNAIPVQYKGVQMDSYLKMHFLIEDVLVTELKTISKFLPYHQASMLTTMKLLAKPKAVIINFNCINIVNEGSKIFFNKNYLQPY